MMSPTLSLKASQGAGTGGDINYGQEGRERGRGEEEVYRRRASSRSCSNAFTCSSSTCARHPGMREKEAPGRVRGPVF